MDHIEQLRAEYEELARQCTEAVAAGDEAHQWVLYESEEGGARGMAEQLLLVEIDADHWKTWTHLRLSTPLEKPGAMTLFHGISPQEHLSLAKHLTAERKVEEFVAGKGVVVKWERLRRQNHWFDALYNACCAAHGCGVRLVEEQVPEAEPTPPIQARRPEWLPGGQKPWFSDEDRASWRAWPKGREW